MARFQLSEDQFIEAYRLALPSFSRVVPYMMLGIGAVNLTAMIVTGRFGQLTIFTTLMFFVLGGWSLIQPNRLAKRLYAQTPEFSSPFTFTLDHVDMRWETAQGNFRQPWKEIASWKESDNLILVYQNAFIHRIILKQALSNDESSLLMTKLAEHKKRR